MFERSVQQMELDLDTRWNNLVTGGPPELPESSEMEMVDRLTAMTETERPRAGFLDALWAQMLDGEREESPLPEPPLLAASVTPVIKLPPARPETRSRNGYWRWGKVAAVLAALLTIAAISALLFADRRNDDDLSTVAQRWSMAGGDPGKTNGNPDAAALADPNVHWRVETGGRIDGVPVVSEGAVFIGNQEHHMFAFDSESGLPMWDVNLRKPITGTAAVGDGIVVVGTTTSLFGLDANTGATVWQRDDLVTASDPTIVQDAIYLVDDTNQLRSLDLATGRDRWTSDPIASTPTFAIDERAGRIVVATPGGILRALSTEDGSQIWEIDPGLGLFGRPLVVGDAVFVSIAGGVARFDGATGAAGPKNVVGFESYPTVTPALALSGDLLFASTDQMVLAYERDTLDVVWVNQQLGNLTGDMTVGESSIYLPGKERTLIAIDRKTGVVQWTLPLDEVAQAAPAVTSERLFISTRAGSVYAIGGGSASILNAPPVATEPDATSPARPLWKSTGGPNALKNPTGIAVAPTGEVWVCDTASDRLQIFDTEGNFLREFGSYGNAPGQFDFGEETAEMEGSAPLGNACGLAFDASGALYVADAGNFRVQRFPASAFGWMTNACCTIRVAGTNYPFPASAAQPDLIIGTEGTGAGQFLFPSAVAVAPNGDIYIGDRLRLDVQRFDATGKLLETIGTATVNGSGDQPSVEDAQAPGSFIHIDGIAVDSVGRLYIADGDTHEVDRLDPDGSWTVLQLARNDYRIMGIAVDDRGNLYVAQIETIGGSFAIYDPEANLILTAGSYGNELGQFDGTAGIAVDDQGNVFTTDWALNRIQKFEIDDQQLGAVSRDAGG